MSNDYDWRVQKDEAWLQIENEIVPLRRKKMEKYTNKYEEELMFEEVANTILSDPLLSRSYWNPSWYPPVPEYTPPKWRRLSTQEVVEIRFKIAQAKANTKTRKVVDSENFWDAWVYLVDELMDLEDLEKLNKNIQSWNPRSIGTDIPPLINPDNFLVQVQKVEKPEWVVDEEWKYSYTDIVDKVSWAVYCCCDDGWTQLLWVVCHRETIALEEVTAFLADTGISNEDECNEAIVSLSQAYWELSKNNKQ